MMEENPKVAELLQFIIDKSQADDYYDPGDLADGMREIHGYAVRLWNLLNPESLPLEED